MRENYPKIDHRTPEDISSQIRKLLKEDYMPGLSAFTDNSKKDLSSAMINIFARFSEIIIDRLNEVPKKNFLAFLNLVGASLLPPQPARVPLTFSLSKGALTDSLVKSGTQVSAVPSEGEEEPVIFETEKELLVTSAYLGEIYYFDPNTDVYSIQNQLLDNSNSTDTEMFSADRTIERYLYLTNDNLLGFSDINKFKIDFQLENIDAADRRDIEWQIWNGEVWEKTVPSADSTNSLSKSGEIEFHGLKTPEKYSVNNNEKRWIRASLLTPVTRSSQPEPGMIRKSQLPVISDINFEIEISDEGSKLSSGFINSSVLDLSKEFFPFGDKPKFGDVFYFTGSDSSWQEGSSLVIEIKIANDPSDSDESPVIPVTGKGRPKLSWQYWDGADWKEFNKKDNTISFTRSGTVNLLIESKPRKTVINGVEDYWIRVRLVSGNYGKDARYELINPSKPDEGYRLIPSTYAPPLIGDVVVNHTLRITERPERGITYNNFSYNDFSIIDKGTPVSIKPFSCSGEKDPSYYLGFSLPAGRSDFPKNKITLFFSVSDNFYNEKSFRNSELNSAKLFWEYWNGNDWRRLTVNDETQQFSRTGLVEFFSPPDIKSKKEFESERFWIRIRLEERDPEFNPKINLIMLNTVMASQTVTVVNEVSGSSDGSENQVFYTTKKPVLDGQGLYIKENNEEFSDHNFKHNGSVRAGKGSEKNWVKWQEVNDFYGSGPEDRHYVIDHITGEIKFGDGFNGMVPPHGIGNIKISEYKTGGGTRGNKPAGTIVELKTSVPYIESVINFKPAFGGADQENQDLLVKRAPREIRHRGRAVTIEDYEDLAIQASSKVERAKCVPLRNLTIDPFAKPLDTNKTGDLGEVSVIIVPRSDDTKPVPSVELISRVKKYLVSQSMPTVNVSVVGPLYLNVNVTAEIALTSMEGGSVVEQEIYRKLENFLHPLKGGPDLLGWDFGRNPYKSDIYSLIESVPGVDYIISLKVEDDGEINPKIKDTGRFLVYSGNHKINMVYNP